MQPAARKVVELLTVCVRCALAEQLCRYVSASTLERLVEDGFLATHTALVRWPLLSITEPLDTWLADDHPSWRGDPNSLSARAQARWHDVATRLMPVYVATPRGAKVTGGVATGQIRQPLQVTHDVHLLECYAALSPEAQATWEGEDHLRSTGWGRRRKVPDAITTIDDARFAIEFAGSYGADRIREFQDWAHDQGISYVLF